MYAAAALLAVCAILSKENAASLPLAILLTEWVFFDRRLELADLAAGAVASAPVVAIAVGVEAAHLAAVILRPEGYTWLERKVVDPAVR